MPNCVLSCSSADAPAPSSAGPLNPPLPHNGTTPGWRQLCPGRGPGSRHGAAGKPTSRARGGEAARQLFGGAVVTQHAKSGAGPGSKHIDDCGCDARDPPLPPLPVNRCSCTLPLSRLPPPAAEPAPVAQATATLLPSSSAAPARRPVRPWQPRTLRGSARSTALRGRLTTSRRQRPCGRAQTRRCCGLAWRRGRARRTAGRRGREWRFTVTRSRAGQVGAGPEVEERGRGCSQCV
jgi:hypothetical protein